MNSINVNAFANSNLQGEIDMRRGHALRSYFKRQSRRQVRHRLAAELRTEMGHHLAEAAEMMSVHAGDVDCSPEITSTATIIAFPNREQRAARTVQVTRKLSRLPFERQQLQVTFLAA